MKNKTKAVIAGAAGIALLTGGSTFALWNASDTANGGKITNGQLDVHAVNPIAWSDVSGDRTDFNAVTPMSKLNGHTIASITSWRMVPGDTVEATQALAVTLEGDNLVAELNVKSAALAAAPVGSVNVSYQVWTMVGATPTKVGTAQPLGTSALEIAAPRTGQDDGRPDTGARLVLPSVTDATTPNVWVTVTAHFNDVTGQVDVKKVSDLSDLTISLNQVRTGVAFK